MRTLCRLRDEHDVGLRRFDEMVGTDIRHDFRAWWKVDIEFMLELRTLLRSSRQLGPSETNSAHLPYVHI